MYRLVKDYSEYDRYDPFEGYTYRIDGSDEQGHMDIKFTNDPAQAIALWFRVGKRFPGNTAILCKKRSEAVEVCKEAKSEFLETLYHTHRCPYKLDYLIDSAAKQVNDGCRRFYESPYGYGDMIYPFDVG